MGGSKITIADIPFFNHLEAGDIMAVSQHLQALSFAAEDMLFYQGDPPNGLFLVTSGSVKTYVYAPGTTKKVVVKLVKAGDYLGEFGLLDGMPRSASAMAEVATEVLLLPSRAFEVILYAGPSLARAGYQRLMHFLPFPLPGGDTAILEPRRSALGVLYALGVDPNCLHFPETMQQLLWQAMQHHINTPQTSSVGRLFDAVAALLGLCDQNQFEGEAAMLVEFTAMQSNHKLVYPYHLEQGVVDWRPMLLAILNEREKDKAWIARKFHNTLAAIIVAVARLQSQQEVLLTGGCFQNKLLLETTVSELRQASIEPYWHHRVPPNDGGLAAGQVMAVLRAY